MDDNLIEEMLEYSESFYKRFTAINGMLGDETYTRRSNLISCEDKYGIKKMSYIYNYAKPMDSPWTTFVREP